MTGHAEDGAIPENPDWRGLADPGTTLIVYIGGRSKHNFVDNLIRQGLAVTTPAAAAVSRAEEQFWRGALAQLASMPYEFGTDQPILIGIGQAFAACAQRQGYWPWQRVRMPALERFPLDVNQFSHRGIP